MPFMQASRIRPLCHSRNPFSPSIALWHHFVFPNQALFHQQRLSSFVTEPAQPIPRDNSGSSTVTASETPSQSGDKDIKHDATHPTIHFKSKLPASFKAKLPKDVVNILVTAQKAASKCEDYHGVIMREVRRSPKLDESTLPWTLPLDERTIPPYARLSIEIQRFHDYMKPNKLETLARKELIERVRRSVQRIANDCTIEIFGSERTGLASATSDIDIRLFRHNTSSNSTLNNLPPSPYERRKLLDALRRLHKALHNNKSYSAPLGITHARYPLLPYTDRRSGLDVQIVLSNDTSHQRAILQQYLQTYPYLDQLYTVIRSFLNVRGLSDVFRGGFGSYPVFMMIVASLQQQPQQGQVEAGEALCSFFEFWSKFDTQTKGISVDPPSVFNKSEYMIMSNATKDKIKEAKITTKPTYMLTLRDPADQTNDLGRQATSMKHFQETCKHIAQKISNDISTGQGSALANLVGSSFMLEQKSRERLRNHGRVVALYNDLPPELVDLANTILEEEQEHKPVKKSRAEEQRPTRRFIKGIKVDDSKKNQRPKTKFTKGIKYDEHAQEELDFPSLVASTEQTPHAHQQEASAEK